MKFLLYFCYLLCMGILVFLIGRFFPRRLIFENKFPFKNFSFEKEGAIYEKLKVRKWKTKWPDGSKIFHGIFGKLYPEKRIEEKSVSKIKTLIKETCVAESTHFAVIILGLFCPYAWQDIPAFILWLIWALWNIPPIIIQRYNRPRLKKVLKKGNEN